MNEELIKLENKLEKLEFQIECVKKYCYPMNPAYQVIQKNLSSEEFDEIIKLLEKIDEKIKRGEKVTETYYEENLRKVLDKNIDYLDCEDLLQSFFENEEYVDAFIGVYGNSIKHKQIIKMKEKEWGKVLLRD